MGICSMAQETQTGVLYQTRGGGWGGRWEGISKGRGYMYTYGWFMLRFDRKQQNSIKQLSFNYKKTGIKKKPTIHRKVVRYKAYRKKMALDLDGNTKYQEPMRQHLESFSTQSLHPAKSSLKYKGRIKKGLGLLLGEISITSDMQMTPPLWQKVKRN